LICEECNKYYELQPGELPGDFDLTCDCGGTLKFKSNIDGVENKTIPTKQTTNLQIQQPEDKQYMNEPPKKNKVNTNFNKVNTSVNKVNTQINTREVVHSVWWVFKVVIILTMAFMTIIALLLFIPVGLIMLLGLYGFYKWMF
jgi:hypothetical protein